MGFFHLILHVAQSRKMTRLKETQEEIQSSDPERRAPVPAENREEESLWKFFAPDISTLCVFLLIVTAVCLILLTKSGHTFGRIWDFDPGSGEDGENSLMPYSEER